jgi:hypothetical protein
VVFVFPKRLIVEMDMRTKERTSLAPYGFFLVLRLSRLSSAPLSLSFLHSTVKTFASLHFIGNQEKKDLQARIR